MQNEKEFADMLFYQIAEREGTTVENVRSEIERALMLGMLNPDPKVQAQWKRIPCKGSIPTVEEALIFLIGEIIE